MYILEKLRISIPTHSLLEIGLSKGSHLSNLIMLCLQSASTECSILIILCNRCKQRHRQYLVSGCVPCLSKIDEVYYYSMQENKKLWVTHILIYHFDPVYFLPNGYVENIITTCHIIFFFSYKKCNLAEAKCFAKMNQFQLYIC